MSCTNCSGTPFSFDVTLFTSNDCFGCENNGCGNNVQNAKCVIYTGPNLSCSGVETNDSLETILQKIDEQICSAVGDYTTYQFNCLDDWFGDAITSEAVFVNAMTEYACEISTNLTTFTDVTFVTYQDEVDARFEDIEVPAITCSSASVTNTDTLQQVLTKYCTKFAAIDTALDISSVDWNDCLVVVTTPDTIAEGFQLLADQICVVKDAMPASLPTFNNSTSCIAGGTTDSLVTTIGLIKTRLCEGPTFDRTDLTWECLTVPTFSSNQDITAALQGLIDQVSDLIADFPHFDEGDFAVTSVGGACDGKAIALQTPLDVDRFVAVSSSDTSPGTLFTKLSTPNSSVSITNVADTTVGVDISTGDKGDIVVSGGGNTWTIDTGVVTLAKMQDISTQKILGRSTASTGDVEQLSLGGNMSLTGGVLNTYGRTLIGVSTYTSSGTWSKPTGCTAVIVVTVAAGGGGGGGTSSAGEAVAGSGGGAGSHQYHFITAGLSATESVVVGSGGAGGISGTSYNGSNGGASSFGAFTDAGGATGGAAMATGTSVAISSGGATGAQGSNPTYQIYGGGGNDGDYGIRLSGTVAVGGKGGASILGGGGNEYSYGSGGDGRAAVNGASTNGYNGTGGIVIVYELS